MAKDFVDRIFLKLFGDKEESPEVIHPVKEKLTRGNRFLSDWEEWQVSSRAAALLLRLESLYWDTARGSGTDVFHIHSTPQANGFFFDDRTGVMAGEFSFVLDYLRDRALEEGYTLYSSEKKYSEKSTSVQVVERHYLKPSLDRSLELPIDQRYGNILMEYVAYDDKPAYLKLMVTCYSDRNYTAAKNFKDLVPKLFAPPSSDQ